ncbi:MAG: hypothetical protein GF313_11550 [Caldithrix sp.]|nr:hypothetical protein [Caldithrix sp.]
MGRNFIVIFCIVMYAATGWAGSPDSTDRSAPNIKPSLTARRTDTPIQIDARFNEAAWQKAAVATNFTEFRPGDGVPPPVKTEVRVVYDTDNLYLAFTAYDDPQRIRASMRDRDRIWDDDNVGFILDTYGDGARAYEFFANPYGIQGDILRTSDNREDMSFDLVFHTEGRITDKGYQVEMAIPFRSISYPQENPRQWRVLFWRNHPRQSRGQYSWVTLDRDNPCFSCQFGYLKGIKNITSEGSLELIPAFVSSQSGALNDSDDPDSGFNNNDITGSPSLTARYAITPGLSLEAAVNPDFSQVESDAARIDVNTTFALSYPEKRPFFQRRSDLFNTNFDVVYTRSINQPLFAAKLTGKFNSTSIGVLSAYDENTPLLIPLEERTEFVTPGKSVSNIVRIKHNFWQDSYIGLIASDRRLREDGFNTVGGIDGRLRLLPNYYFEWQAVGSLTEEPADSALTADIEDTFFGDDYSAALDGESFSGHGIYASLEREARLWNFDIDFRESSPTLRADNGFITRNNSRRIFIWSGWYFRPNTRLFERITPNFVVGRFWNTEGVGKDQFVRPELDIVFKSQTNIEFGYIVSKERFNNIVFGGIRRFEFEFGSEFSEFFKFEFDYEGGRSIARFEDPPVLGKGYETSLEVAVKPLSRWIIESDFVYSKLDHPHNGQNIFEGYIVRTRTNFQFTRELFLRLILQYDEFDRSFNLEPLVTYRINPFSLFYIGSTSHYRDFNEPSVFKRTSRQYFLKFQYLFQL